MSRFHLNEVDTVAKQMGAEFSPSFPRISRYLQESRDSSRMKRATRLHEKFEEAGIKFEQRHKMGNKYVDFYLPDHNTALQIMSPSHYNFDGQTQNAKGKMFIRAVSGAEEKPTVQTVSIRKFNKKNQES
jgi:very-short-patch-repair endonuclease